MSLLPAFHSNLTGILPESSYHPSDEFRVNKKVINCALLDYFNQL